MTGIPPAALALLRAELADARTDPRATPEDLAQRLADALTDGGWQLRPTPEQPA